jgi:hypothetical protein
MLRFIVCVALTLLLLSGCATYVQTLDNASKSYLAKEAVNKINHLSPQEAIIFTRIYGDLNAYDKNLCRINLKPTENTDWSGLLSGGEVSSYSLTPLSGSALFVGTAPAGIYRLALYCQPGPADFSQTKTFINTPILIRIQAAQASYYVGDIYLQTTVRGLSRSGTITSIDIKDDINMAYAELSQVMPVPNITMLPIYKELARVQ